MNHSEAIGLKVFEDRKYPGDWRVEYEDDDGGCYVAVFTGPGAEQRARDYYRILAEAGASTAERAPPNVVNFNRGVQDNDPLFGGRDRGHARPTPRRSHARLNIDGPRGAVPARCAAGGRSVLSVTC